MNKHITSFLGAVGAWIAGLTSLILMLPFITPEDAPAITEHVNAISAGVVGLLGIIVVKAVPWLIAIARAWFSKRFSDGSEGHGGGTGRGGPVPLIVLCAICAAMALTATSCSFLDDYRVQGTAAYYLDDGSKAGMTFHEDAPPEGFIRYAVRDPETGEVTGFINVMGSRRVEAAK